MDSGPLPPLHFAHDPSVLVDHATSRPEVAQALGFLIALIGGEARELPPRCPRGFTVLWDSQSLEYALLPALCHRRECLLCASLEASDRVQRLRIAVENTRHPVHMTLTVPDATCTPGRLRSWLDRLHEARRAFLRRSNRCSPHGPMGTRSVPAPAWLLWKLEVTYNSRDLHWHPHFHILCDGWPPQPTPPRLSRLRGSAWLAACADYYRLRWADCASRAGLPLPSPPTGWRPGDAAPGRLAKSIELTPYEKGNPVSEAELAKYVTKIRDFIRLRDHHPKRFAEWCLTLNTKPKPRTWQAARGVIPPRRRDQAATERWYCVGNLYRLLHHREPHHPDRVAAEGLLTDLGEMFASRKDPGARHAPSPRAALEAWQERTAT